MTGEPDPCVAFLQWALPRLGLRWAGFRRVRRQVCRRIRRRAAELGLPSLDAYRDHLEAHPAEWDVLRSLTPVTISRFGRDRAVFGALAADVLPALGRAAHAAGRDRLRAWSAACASGEEAYTLAMLRADVDVLATDVHPPVLARARAGRYDASSVGELAPEVRARGFVREAGGGYVVRPTVRRAVTVARHDLRDPPPDGPFDLVLCRNAAFTYFAPDGRCAVLDHLATALQPGGALVVGLHEDVSDPAGRFRPWPGTRAVHRYVAREPNAAQEDGRR